MESSSTPSNRNHSHIPQHPENCSEYCLQWSDMIRHISFGYLSMATKYIALIEESGRCVDDYYTEKELIAFYQQFKFAKKVIAELKDKYNEIVELPEEYTFWENL